MFKWKSAVHVESSQLLLDGNAAQPQSDVREVVTPGFNPTPENGADGRSRHSNPHKISVNVNINRDQEYKGHALNDSIVEETPGAGDYHGGQSNLTSSIHGYQGPGYGRESDIVNHFGKTPNHEIEEENRI